MDASSENSNRELRDHIIKTIDADELQKNKS